MDCKVRGCEKKAHARGWCGAHYFRWKAYGRPHGSPRAKPPKNEGTVCNLLGCDREQYGGKGWCRKHHRQVTELGYEYPVGPRPCKGCKKQFEGQPNALFCTKPCKMRWHRKHGSYTEEASIRLRGRCKIEKCRGGVHAHGLCKKHDMRRWRHGDPLGGFPEEAPTCSREGCEEIAGRVSGLCPAHYHNEYYYGRIGGSTSEAERARRNARRSHLKKSTPSWADLDEILEIYQNCPEGHEVDHIVPLAGKLVSGLHISDNLQYLTIGNNRRKSNSFVG